MENAGVPSTVAYGPSLVLPHWSYSLALIYGSEYSMGITKKETGTMSPRISRELLYKSITAINEMNLPSAVRAQQIAAAYRRYVERLDEPVQSTAR